MSTVEIYFCRGPLDGRTLNVPAHVATAGIAVDTPTAPVAADYSTNLDAPTTIPRDRTIYHYLRRDRADNGARIFVPLTTTPATKGQDPR